MLDIISPTCYNAPMKTKPNLPKDKKRDRMIFARVTYTEYETIRLLAEHEKLSLSAYLRQILLDII